ncbi:MAG: hypothetical protein K0Q95_3339 [Bacteroidota bacterium]|nr:hypothetical protein [Bacteroidota bacterium]
MLTCPFKTVTGFDCPGCGMQRSFIALLQGNIVESFYLYPALLPLFVLFIITAVHVIFRLKRGDVIIKYFFICTVGIILISYAFKLNQ